MIVDLVECLRLASIGKLINLNLQDVETKQKNYHQR